MSASFQKLSVLMPVYNEARTLRKIVYAVLNSPVEMDLELVCVDDQSSDQSPEILRELAEEDPRIRVFRHEKNQGKGAAIRTAIRHMTGDLAVIQDADLEYDPAEFPQLLAPILQGKADAVFGSRFASSGQRKVLMYWHGVANRLLTWMTNVLNDVNLTDMETCYKVVRADILRQIPLNSNRFGIEPELTTRLAQWNLRLYEVPISYHGRSYAEGKKIGLKDAVDAVWSLLKYRFLDPCFTTHHGYYILESLRRAKGFNRWVLAQFREHLGDRVFEAGCGIGNFTEQLLDRQRLVCVDADPFYIESIRRRFGHLANVRAEELDLADPDQVAGLADERPDSLIALNVVEHLDDDRQALRSMYDLLLPGGKAVILVPAHPWLFSPCDEALGHFRRYTEAELREKMEQAGFELLSLRPFNRLGVYGWWVNKVLGRKFLRPGQMRLFEWLLPVAKLLEFLRLGPGLSLIAVARKPDHSTR